MSNVSTELIVNVHIEKDEVKEKVKAPVVMAQEMPLIKFSLMHPDLCVDAYVEPLTNEFYRIWNPFAPAYTVRR